MSYQSYRYWITLYRADGTFTKVDFRCPSSSARTQARFLFDTFNSSFFPEPPYVSFSYRKARKQ